MLQDLNYLNYSNRYKEDTKNFEHILQCLSLRYLLCEKVANERLDEFRRQASFANNVLTHFVPINGRLLNENSHDKIVLYLVRGENDVDLRATIIEKVFNTLIQNLRANFANFKNNFRKRFLVSNVDLLQIKSVKYSNDSHKERDLKCSFSKQGDEANLVC